MMVVSIGFFGKVDHRHGRITELTKEFQSVIVLYCLFEMINPCRPWSDAALFRRIWGPLWAYVPV
jgi:hypothetical protein